MIEVFRGSRRGGHKRGLLFVKFSESEGIPSMCFQAAQTEDVVNVVAAGDPKITGRLRELGWVKVQPESKTMAEAGANLLHAASALHEFVKKIELVSVQDLGDADRLALALEEAINAYTDNVAPPEDEPEPTYHGVPVSVRSYQIVYHAGSEPLFDRAVMPDEVDEDPELDAQEFGALDLSLVGNLRALLVCLDPKAPDDLLEPFAVLERITTLVGELEKHANALGMTEALRMATATVEELLTEREVARKLVHAATDLVSMYLSGRAIAESAVASAANDSIHEWLDLQPAGHAKASTTLFVEKRLGIRPLDLPSPRESVRQAGGFTSAEFAAGVAKFPKPPSLPTDGFGKLLTPDDSAGTKVAAAFGWVLNKLFPNF